MTLLLGLFLGGCAAPRNTIRVYDPSSQTWSALDASRPPKEQYRKEEPSGIVMQKFEFSIKTDNARIRYNGRSINARFGN